MHPTKPSTDTLQFAISRARRSVLRNQRADGSWDAACSFGPSSTARALVALHWLGQLSSEDRDAGAVWLRAVQRPDGGFLARPFADGGDVGVTAVAEAALGLAEGSEAQEAAARAKEFVRQKGGDEALIQRMGAEDASALFCALSGRFDAALLPDPGLGWALLPGVVEWAATRVRFEVVVHALWTSLVTRRLTGKYGSDGAQAGWLAARERRRALELLRLFQNPDGSFNGSVDQTALLVPALVIAGLPVDSEPIRLGLQWLLSRRVYTANGLRFEPFSADVATTAGALGAWVSSGTSGAEPELGLAMDWLLSRQVKREQPWPHQRQTKAVRTGGWALQSGNDTMATAGDSARVMGALGHALAHRGEQGGEEEGARRARVRAALTDGVAFLSSMQNPDGGWSAFAWGLPPRPMGAVMTERAVFPSGGSFRVAKSLLFPSVGLGDPSSEDITGAALQALGSSGLRVGAQGVDAGIRFLKKHQIAAGAWWGRGVCNYLAATAQVLRGLSAVGEDREQSYIRKAIAWMLSCQNPDGGFGETTRSYQDPTSAGRGPSTAPLTAAVLSALVEQGLGDSDEASRAAEYLQERQRPDGTWPNDDYLVTETPPDRFYFFSAPARHLPLEALSLFARRDQLALEEPYVGESWGRWSSEVLGAARHRGDAPADAAVAGVYQSGDVPAVNALIRQIFENDDPVPPGLPAGVREYFAATAALPDWMEPSRIKTAQKLFEDHGIQITFGLFCSSLPQAYAGANGALVLQETGAMLSRVQQRIMETAQFLFDVLDPGGFGPDGRAVRSAQRVRLMHAGVRGLLLSRKAPLWNVPGRGLPINQEDLVGTLMTFSVVTFEAMRRFGVKASDREGDDWIHHWCVVGHLLGIERELMPRSLRDAQDLMEGIRQRQWVKSEQGARLTAALCRMVEGFFTKGTLSGFAPTLIRFLAGDDCADLLEVPESDWTRAFIELGALVAGTLDVDEREGLLERGMGLAMKEAMRAVVDFQRADKGVPFRIPASLKSTVLPDSAGMRGPERPSELTASPPGPSV